MPEIRCHGCGKIYRQVAEFENVEQAGLSLRGSCPGCGEVMGIGPLWKRSKLIDLRGKEDGEYTDI